MKLIGKCSKEFSLPNFWESTYKVKGREYPCYEMTKGGFTMVAIPDYYERKAMLENMYHKKLKLLENIE